MDNNYDYCVIGSCTDVGRTRRRNEDFLGMRDTRNGRIVVVCDGMGGHVGGQVASHIAVETILDFLTQNYFDDPREAINNAVISANQAILARCAEQPELNGMGSTCVMLIIRDGMVYYGHVGDSRIYIVQNHNIRQITKDQSFVQMLVDAGQLTEEQAEHHERKNEITNALGLATMTPPILCKDPIAPAAGTCFLLCSDGLSGMVPADKMERVVSHYQTPIAERARLLVEAANEAGGLDNITVQLVEFVVSIGDSTDPIPNSGVRRESRKRFFIWLSIILAAVALIAVGVVLLLQKGISHKPATDEGVETDSVVSQKLPSKILIPQERVTDKGDFVYLVDISGFFTEMLSECVIDEKDVSISGISRTTLTLKAERGYSQITGHVKTADGQEVTLLIELPFTDETAQPQELTSKGGGHLAPRPAPKTNPTPPPPTTPSTGTGGNLNSNSTGQSAAGDDNRNAGESTPKKNTGNTDEVTE